MATGFFDDLGIWHWGEDDPAYPFSDLLNRLPESLATVLGSAWVPYTPALAGGGTPVNVGSSGTRAARYRRLGKTVHVRFDVTFGGTGITTPAVTWVLELPPTLPAVGTGATDIYGTVEVNDASSGTGRYVAFARRVAAGDGVAFNIAGAGFLNGTAPMAWAAGDSIRGTITYEAA